MKKTTVKGTNDYLPQEVAIRDYLQNTICNIYQNCGFERISTPAIEDAENLDKSEGGDNLNLIFKILKRGQKLDAALGQADANQLSDMGLRYDLTLPLSRYYANNKAKLMLPMKCIQIDKVYRAERPQKGRLREFVQCDIDIIGSDSINCEIELILTTAKALLAIGMKDFTVKINNRKILRSMLSKVGFQEEELDSVCITFDKMDKIGVEGVEAELKDKNIDDSVITEFLKVLEQCPLSLEECKQMVEDHSLIEELEMIIQTVTQLSDGTFDIVFDLSLVRGQGYYTGTVFEVQSNEFRGAIAGGGRYDNLVGKFAGEDIPAVGFSIGFERIFAILNSEDFKIPQAKQKLALLYASDEFVLANQKANELRDVYDVSLFEKPKKVGKLINRIEEKQYDAFMIYEKNAEIKTFQNK